MKIVTQGRRPAPPPREKRWLARCPQCGCEAEVDENEFHDVGDGWQGVTCPMTWCYASMNKIQELRPPVLRVPRHKDSDH